MKRAQRFVVLVAVISIATALGGLMVHAAVTSTSGYAYGSKVDLLGLSVGESPKVALTGSPGSDTDSTATLSLLTLGSLGSQQVSIEGQHGDGGSMTATSTITDIDVLVLEIDAITTSCHVDDSGVVDASVQILGGSIGGQPIPSNPEVETAMGSGPVRIALNQQSVASTSGHTEVTVTGVEVVIDTLLVDGTVTLGEVNCSVGRSAAVPTSTTTTTAVAPTILGPGPTTTTPPPTSTQPENGGGGPTAPPPDGGPTSTTPGDESSTNSVAESTTTTEPGSGGGFLSVDGPQCPDCLPGFVAPLILSAFGVAVLITALVLRGSLDRVWKRVSGLTNTTH